MTPQKHAPGLGKFLTAPHWYSSWLLQDVLCKVAGASAMTVAEATTIADNALEHSVRTVLASLQAAEILKSTDGRPVHVFHKRHCAAFGLCRCTIWSFHNKNSTPAAGAGALIWHGRDLRRYRRLLSPPLQRLLTCPGVAALGRGVASMPASYAHQVRPLAVAECWVV